VAEKRIDILEGDPIRGYLEGEDEARDRTRLRVLADSGITTTGLSATLFGTPPDSI
jgi:hypothetical protein